MKLTGFTIFSKIDFSDAHLLAIRTNRGLVQYNGLPFGVKCVPVILSKFWKLCQVMYYLPWNILLLLPIKMEKNAINTNKFLLVSQRMVFT